MRNEINNYIVNAIVGNQNPRYSPDFVSKVCKQVGVSRTIVKDVCSSLHCIAAADGLRDIVRVLAMAAFALAENGTNGFRSKMIALYIDRQKVEEALRIAFRSMDTDLMPLLKYGKKSFNEYSYEWKRRIKCVVLSVVAHEMALLEPPNA